MVVRRREADDWWFLVDANSGGSLRGFGSVTGVVVAIWWWRVDLCVV